MDDDRSFVARQYASLVTSGLDDTAARARLGEVLGAAALASLDATDDASRDDATPATTRVLEAARQRGGNVAAAQAALIRSHAEARLFTLDWWRPIRTFLLYIVFLLGLGITVAILYAAWVLPAFSHLDATLAVNSGAASWLLSKAALRLWAPLLVMALLFALLAIRWWRMRLCMARLETLAGQSRWPWLYGRGGDAYRMLACLEHAAALHASGVTDADVLATALRTCGWPQGKSFATHAWNPGDALQQAARLGTFADELEWQRRLAWTAAQSQLELSRDRLILCARVVFYILIGILVTVLYLPIFSVASQFGVH